MSSYRRYLPPTATNTGLRLQSVLNKSNFTTVTLTAVVKKVRNLPLTWRGAEIYLQWVNEASSINVGLKQNIILAKFEPVVIKLRLRKGKRKNLQSDLGTRYEGCFKIMMKTRKSSSFEQIGMYEMDPEIFVQSYIESGVPKRFERIDFGNGIQAVLSTTINVIGQNFLRNIANNHVGIEQKARSDSAEHDRPVEDTGLKSRNAIDFPGRADGLKEDGSCSSPTVMLVCRNQKGKKNIQF